MLSNAICIGNGKGGVGKTSIVANVAGVAAANDWRVLAVDLDPQGNLGSDFGFKQRGIGDEGAELLAAVVEGRAPRPLIGVRPNLDVVAAGRQTPDLHAILATRRLGDPARIADLAAALAPLADGYDLVLFDCPPAGGVAVDAALVASRWLVIPVKFDEGSLDGLELMAGQFAGARRTHNPALALMGVVLFDFSTAGTVIRREVRTTLVQELGQSARVFQAVIRKSERGAYDMRRRGLLASEYQRKAAEAAAGTSVADRIRAARRGTPLERYSTGAAGIADDYTDLTAEILEIFGGAPAVTAGDPWTS